MMRTARTLSGVMILCAAAWLNACGGSGGAPSDPPAGQPQPPVTGPEAPAYTVGGVLSGLGPGNSLVLALVNSQAVPLHTAVLAADGSYRSGPVPAGTAYRLQIQVQPVGQSCTIANAEGVVSGDVANIRVECAVNRYAVGGTIAGSNAKVILRNVANGEMLAVPGNGGFSFAQPVVHGGTYAVDVADSAIV